MNTRPSSECSMDSGCSGDGNSTYAGRVEEELLVKGGGYPDRRQTQVRGRRRKLIIVAVISLVLSVISLLAILLVGAFVFFNNIDIIPGGQQQVGAGEEVCLPCVQLNSDPVSNKGSSLLDLLEVRNDDDNNSICCARTNVQFAALFKLIIERQQMIQKLADILEPAGGQNISETNSSSAASAHLLIQAGAGQGGLQQWKGPDVSGLSHVRPGLTFHDNIIYIIRPGMYYVYCQMLYNRGDDKIDAVPQVVSSYVYRESLVDPVMSGIVFKTRHTRYSRQTDRHTSYVGGLLALHKGDKLYVKVSEPSVVSSDEKGSFFGLFMVGE